MIRFEILLPLFSNDGRPMEAEKFLATDDELVQAFGATSTDNVTVRGQWKYQSTRYSDQLLRVRVDVEDAAESWNTMRALSLTDKTTLLGFMIAQGVSVNDIPRPYSQWGCRSG